MVPGASNSLIRSLTYFPDASNARQWGILIGWTLLGGALALAGHYRSRRAMHVAESTLDELELEPESATANA